MRRDYNVAPRAAKAVTLRSEKPGNGGDRSAVREDRPFEFVSRNRHVVRKHPLEQRTLIGSRRLIAPFLQGRWREPNPFGLNHATLNAAP